MMKKDKQWMGTVAARLVGVQMKLAWSFTETIEGHLKEETFLVVRLMEIQLSNCGDSKHMALYIQ